MKKKIIFLVNSLGVGGAEKVVVTILEKILNDLPNTNDIELICLEKNNFYKFPNDLKITYLSNNNGNINSFLKLLLIPILAFKLKKYIKNNHIDLVHSHLYRSNYINVLSKLMGSKHEAQVVNHGIVSRYKIKGLLGRFNLFLIKYLYAHADMIILISKEMKNDLNDLFKFTNHQIVINNPYNIQHILQYKNYQSRAFLFDKQKKYLIGMGRLISLKRYQDIINVLSKLNNHIELILLGEGEEKNKLQELSHSLKIGNRVHFLGNVDNPFQYLSKADIFILPSETEGFPNSIIEALACEIPIISSDCLSGPREILQIKPNFGERLVDNIEVCDYGILYPTAHIECLQKAVELLLKDETLRISFKKKSFDRANQFNVDNIIIKYKEVLDIE